MPSADYDLVAPDAILPSLRAPSKASLFATLAARGAALTGIDHSTIIAALNTCEALGTTGFGSGVALPHGRLAAVAQPMALFARLDEPLDYGALDGAPVDLVLCLLSPATGTAEHLKALARASRMLRDPALAAKLRGAADVASIHALLAVPPQARAA